MGPGAGVHGGRVMAQGTPDEVAARPESLTGQYLAGALRDPDARRARRATPTRRAMLRIAGARGNNLKNVDASTSRSACSPA